MAAKSATDQGRALELLAGSARKGCTEAFLLAHGFTVELLADMVRAGLATAQIEHAHAGGQTRVHITDAGRQALRAKRTQWTVLPVAE
jgi:DNA-binding PadR family transcriptional regulator